MMAYNDDEDGSHAERFESEASGVWDAQHARADSRPPMALASEAAVLAHALNAPDAAIALAGSLTVEHFYSEAHRRIFEAIQTLVAAGRPAQTPGVLDELTRTGRIVQVDRHYLVEVVRWASEQAPIEASVAHLDDLYRRRKFIASCHEFVAHGYAGAESTTELLDRAQAAVVDLAVGAARKGLPVLEGAELAAELPELPWLVPALGVAPGAPVLVAGYGYSRKTMALQSMAVAIAAGKLVWGVYGCRQGGVLHIDYEQGRRLTQERYQRLARGMGVDLATLPIQVAALPDMHLDTPGAEATLLRACEGRALVIVDSLRAAAPTADENSSEVRQYLDMLGRVSEKTGAAFTVIHHAKKPQKDDKAGSSFSIRGSGALFDACSGIFIFEGEKGQPTTVHHNKERNRGVTVPDFGIDAVDLENPMTAAPNWALRVVHLEGEQLGQRDAFGAVESKQRRLADACERVLQFLMTHPGASKRMLRESLDGAKDTLDAALEQLLVVGKVVDRKSVRGAAYHVV